LGKWSSDAVNFPVSFVLIFIGPFLLIRPWGYSVWPDCGWVV